MSFNITPFTDRNFEQYTELDQQVQDSIHFLLNNINSLGPELIGIAHTLVAYHRFTSTYVEDSLDIISISPKLNYTLNNALRACYYKI